jgi:hypothetical protein
MAITGKLIRSATGRLLRTVSGVLRRCGCCGECVEYWRADACAMPEDLPSHVLDCLRASGATTIWVRVGTLCTTILGPGDAIEPGDTVVYDDRCYTVIDEQRHKAGVTGCVDDGEIPGGAVIVEGPTIPCQAQCDTDFCRAGFLDYVAGDSCGAFGEPRYFCRQDLELCRTCFDPTRTSPGEGCFILDPDGQHAGTVPAEDDIYSIVLLSCHDDCCPCENAAEVAGAAVADGCLYNEIAIDPFTAATIDPPLKCCCGSPTANAAATWTLTANTLSLLDDGNGYTLEVLGAPITGIVPGECATVTLRQQNYTGGAPDGAPIDTAVDACAALCGPSTYAPTGVPVGSGAGWTETSSLSCNSATHTKTFSGGTLEIAYSVSWSRTGPTIAAPCAGGC